MHRDDVILVLVAEEAGALEEGKDLAHVRRVVVLHLPTQIKYYIIII